MLYLHEGVRSRLIFLEIIPSSLRIHLKRAFEAKVLPFRAQGVSPFLSPNTVFASHFWLWSRCAVYEVALDPPHISHVLLIAPQTAVKKDTGPLSIANWWSGALIIQKCLIKQRHYHHQGWISLLGAFAPPSTVLRCPPIKFYLC